jgi:hypothetical protein
MMENTMANEHVIPVAAAEAEAAVAEPVFVHT